MATSNEDFRLNVNFAEDIKFAYGKGYVYPISLCTVLSLPKLISTRLTLILDCNNIQDKGEV